MNADYLLTPAMITLCEFFDRWEEEGASRYDTYTGALRWQQVRKDARLRRAIHELPLRAQRFWA